MHAREVGDTVSVNTGLLGNLTLESADRPAVFVGTGTGIVPLIALLRHYLDQGGSQAYFVFGEKTKSQLLYKEMLEQLEILKPVDVSFAVSREEWAGHTGYVQELLPEIVSELSQPADFYLCGVPATVVGTKDKLDELAVSSEHVHSEGWEDAQVTAESGAD